MSEAKFIKKQPFVMFPINKSTSGYSYKNGNATINIQFSRNVTRVSTQRDIPRYHGILLAKNTQPCVYILFSYFIK